MHNRQYIIPAFIFTIIVVTLLMPATELFKSSFKNGDKWKHSSVVAPFDFPILKTEAEYENDLESAKQRYVPIYNYEKSVGEKIERELYERVNTILTSEVNDSLRMRLINQISKTVANLYDVGIVDENGVEINKNNDGLVIRLSREGRVENSSFRNFYTVDRAKYLAKKSLNSRLLHELKIENYISPNIIYNDEINNIEINEISGSIPNSSGFVRQGSKIVDRGEIITHEIFQKLQSLKSEAELRSESQNSITVLIGNLFFVILVISLTLMFMNIIGKEFFEKVGNVYFILFLFILMTTFSMVVSKVSWLNIYLVPFAIIPFYVLNFYNIRISVFVYVSILLICSMFAPEPIDFFFINLISGLFGVFTIKNSYQRKKIFGAVGVILLTYILSYLSISFMKSLSLNSFNWKILVWFVANVLMFLGMFQIMFIFEKLFGFVTSISLLEFCDTNRRLLRLLAKNAPGTYQHSVQVANLAEAAAKEIGADPLLTRAGALYHDIGKLENPSFFIENNFGKESPHKEMDELKSVNVIKNHVTDGVKLAKNYKLPQVLIDFIVSHHAKSLIFYFYHSYKQKNPDEQIDESLFRYNGQNPVSKEQVVCMVSDSLEAAARTLKEHTPEAISNLVEKITENHIKEGNFADARITISEIESMKRILKRKLEGVYHSRIVYPERDK